MYDSHTTCANPTLTTVTAIHLIDGFAIHCMGSLSGVLLNPPAVFLEGRDLVMVLEQHSTNHRESAALPSVRCERPLSHPRYGERRV